MAQAKMYILRLGSITCDSNALVALSTMATKSNPAPTCKFEPFPVWAVYIDHPDAKILFDTGLAANCLTGGEPEATLERIPISFEDGEELEYQLSLCGVRPEEIDYVVISHLHHDHAGKIGLFKNAKIVVQEAELEAARYFVNNVNPMGVYLKQDVDIDADWMTINGDYELVDGVKLLLLPGHAEGLQGMQLELENEGTVILTSDACYTTLNYGPPARPAGSLIDSKSYYKSMAKIRAIADATDAMLIFGHDIKQFETLKKAPEFYD